MMPSSVTRFVLSGFSTLLAGHCLSLPAPAQVAVEIQLTDSRIGVYEPTFVGGKLAVTGSAPETGFIAETSLEIAREIKSGEWKDISDESPHPQQVTIYAASSEPMDVTLKVGQPYYVETYLADFRVIAQPGRYRLRWYWTTPSWSSRERQRVFSPYAHLTVEPNEKTKDALTKDSALLKAYGRAIETPFVDLRQIPAIVKSHLNVSDPPSYRAGYKKIMESDVSDRLKFIARLRDAQEMIGKGISTGTRSMIGEAQVELGKLATAYRPSGETGGYASRVLIAQIHAELALGNLQQARVIVEECKRRFPGAHGCPTVEQR